MCGHRTKIRDSVELRPARGFVTQFLLSYLSVIPSVHTGCQQSRCSSPFPFINPRAPGFRSRVGHEGRDQMTAIHSDRDAALPVSAFSRALRVGEDSTS